MTGEACGAAATGDGDGGRLQSRSQQQLMKRQPATCSRGATQQQQRMMAARPGIVEAAQFVPLPRRAHGAAEGRRCGWILASVQRPSKMNVRVEVS